MGSPLERLCICGWNPATFSQSIAHQQPLVPAFFDDNFHFQRQKMVPGGLTDPTSPRILFMYAHLPHAGLLLLLYAGAGVWVSAKQVPDTHPAQSGGFRF